MTSNVSRNSRRQYALVKWLDGVYSDTYTHDVDVTWIKDFDSSSPCNDESYAIEWRQPGKQPPKKGWPVYNGLVIDVSYDLEYLRETKVTKENEQQQFRSTPNRSQSCSLLDINSEAFRAMMNEFIRNASPSSQRRKSTSSLTEEPATVIEKVTVGKSLEVPKSVYQLAKHATSPGRMIRPLLRQAFSRRRLINSTYAGQIRRKGTQQQVQKPGLKKYQKMADIQAFVLEKFPTISQSSFGAIVNSFLGKQANEIHQMEYVEESESEDDWDSDSSGRR